MKETKKHNFPFCHYILVAVIVTCEMRIMGLDA